MYELADNKSATHGQSPIVAAPVSVSEVNADATVTPAPAVTPEKALAAAAEAIKNAQEALKVSGADAAQNIVVDAAPKVGTEVKAANDANVEVPLTNTITVNCETPKPEMSSVIDATPAPQQSALGKA